MGAAIDKGELRLLRRVWQGMKQRCSNPNTKHWRYYGKRGIQVCERWRGSFENFLADMGPRPSPKHSIDRINSNGNYEPSNCRWATWRQQMETRRPKALFTVHAYGVKEAIAKFLEADARWRAEHPQEPA